MQWLNEPVSWQRNGDVLRVSVDPGTDFWRTTGYGYVRDNGHVYGDRLPGDLDVSVRIRGAFASQYDQAGIMLRADQETWLKTGLEFFEGRLRLSTVLTIGRSSWMVADLPARTGEVTLRASRRGDAVEVRYAAGDGAAELAALVFMPPDCEMLAGIVCAAPEGPGFSVAFHDLRIVGREWGSQEAADDVGWAGETAARAGGWAPEQAAGTGASWASEPAWEDERAGDTAAGWARDPSGDEAGDWAGGKPGGSDPGWAADKPGDRAVGWARDRSDDRDARDGSGNRGAGWAGDPPNGEAGDWAGDKPGEVTGGWGTGEPAGAEPRPAADRPGGKPAAGKSPAGVPDGWADELPGDESLDWAKPRASEPAADWDRLSQSLSTTSWNAFAAAKPGGEQPAEPAPDQPGKPAADVAAGQASQDREDSDGDRPGPPPEAASLDQEAASADQEAASADQETASTTATAAGLEEETASQDGQSRGRNGRGRNKAKQPVPPALPPPADPADEWISLLTADSAEELSGPAGQRADREPGQG